MIFIGIDPGVNGGIAVIQDSFSSIELTSMPDNEMTIWNTLRGYPTQARCIAVIEKIPTAIFGVDKSSCSKLYGSYMSLRMALIASGIKFDAVPAKNWQKVAQIPSRAKGETTTKWKNRLKDRAKYLYPNVGGITLKTCDALLIAYYCKTIHKMLKGM